MTQRIHGFRAILAIGLLVLGISAGWHCATAAARVQQTYEQRAAEFEVWRAGGCCE